MNLKRILIGVVALAALGFAGFHAFLYSIDYYASAPVHVRGGAAIGGYDPVAYFTEARPVQGSAEFQHEWNGARWHFASAENRDAFRAEPERYAPRFGGYCAYAVSQGYTAKTDPQAWEIDNGRLYLNYDLDTRALWRRNKIELIAAGEKNWPGVIQD